MELIDVQIPTLYAALYKHYADEAICKVTVLNDSGVDLKNAAIAIFIPGYMDSPTKSEERDVITDEEEVTFEFPVVLNQNVLTLLDSTTINAEISVLYKNENQPQRMVSSFPVELYHPNAMTWDDDRKLASFITPLEANVRSLSRGVANTVSQMNTEGLQKVMLQAMTMFDALSTEHLSYVRDPQSPLSGDNDTLDYIQYPRQTLEAKTGDCDDLTVLYCSLLESIGIETAFITVPGHVFMMFNTKQLQAGYSSITTDRDKVIFYNGFVWIPVETTLVGKHFKEAWFNAAQSIQIYKQRGTISYYPTVESHATYAPVALPPKDVPFHLNRTKVEQMAQQDIQAIKTHNYSNTISELEYELSMNPEDASLYMKLGVIHAEYEYYDEAIAAMKQALELDQDNWLIHYNFGMIFFRQGDYENARKALSKANELEPQNENVLVSLARIFYALEQYDTSKDLFESAVALQPLMRQRFSYLSPSSDGLRASEGSEGDSSGFFLLEADAE